jgi:hypothetical protein
MKALMLILAIVGAQAASAQSVVFEEVPLPAAGDFMGDYPFWGPTTLISNGGDTLFVRLTSGDVVASHDGGKHWNVIGTVPGDFTGSHLTNGALTPDGRMNIHWEMLGDAVWGNEFRIPLPKLVEDANDWYSHVFFDSDGASVRVGEPLFLDSYSGASIGRNDRVFVPYSNYLVDLIGLHIIDGYDASYRDTLLNVRGRTERIMAHGNGEVLLLANTATLFSTDNGENWVQVPRPPKLTEQAILLGDQTLFSLTSDGIFLSDIRSGTMISEYNLPDFYSEGDYATISHTGAVLVWNQQRAAISLDRGMTWTQFNHPNLNLILRGNTIYSMSSIKLARIHYDGTETDITGNLRSAYDAARWTVLSEGGILALAFEEHYQYFGSLNHVLLSTNAGLDWVSTTSQDIITRDLFPLPDGRVGLAGDGHSLLNPETLQLNRHPSELDVRMMIHAKGTEFALLQTDVYFVHFGGTRPPFYELLKRTVGGTERAWTTIRPDMAFYQIGSYSDGRIVARGGIRNMPNQNDHYTIIHLYESTDAGETWTQLTDQPSTVKFFHHDHDLMRVFRVNQDRWLEMHTEGVSIPLFQLNASEVPKNMLTFASNSMVFQTSEGFYGTLDGGSTWMPLHTPFDANKVDIANAGGHFVAIDRDALRLYRTPSIYPTSINTPASVAQSGSVSVTTYPNPTSSMVAFQVNLPIGSEVEITLYDVLGRRVASIQPSRLSSGTHNLSMSMTHLAKGVYVYSMSVGSTRFSGRIVRL